MPARNYGPRGCLVVVGSLVLLGAVLYGAIELITESGPDALVIRSMTTALVKQAVTDRAIDRLAVRKIYSRRERYSLTVDRWTIEGIAHYAVGGSEPEEFIAVVRTECDDVQRLDCWALTGLSLNGRTYRP